MKRTMLQSQSSIQSNRSNRSNRSLDSSFRSCVSLKSCLKDPAVGKTPSQEYDLKKVIFDKIQVREYPQIMGDNPAVSEGVPLTIGWDCQHKYHMNIDMYEYTRAPNRRRGRKKLLISSKRRVQNLVEIGYSFESIGQTILEVNKARALRLESVRASGWNGPLDVMSGALETTGAAIRKVGRRGSKILLTSVTAALTGMKIKQIPRQKSVSPPAG